MTGCTDLADLIDMANVGQGLLERIDLLTKTEGPFKNWTPADDPCEIVFDLVNALDDALAVAPPAPAEAQARVVIGEADKVWLLRTLEREKYTGHCGEENSEIKARHDHNERCDRIAALLSGSAPKPAGVEITEEMVEAEARRLRCRAWHPRPDSDWDVPGMIHDDSKEEWRKIARTALTAALSGDAG